jgi:hypothetical protein
MKSLPSPLGIAALFRETVDVSGLARVVGGPKALATALQELRIELKRIALDQQLATSRGDSMAKAVRDFDRYPVLAKFHTAIGDGLRWTMPRRLVEWCRPLFAFAPDSRTERLVATLLGWAVHAARSASDDDVRAASRTLLFEAVRIALVLHAELEEPERRLLDDDSYLSILAEQALNRWLDDDTCDGADVLVRAIEAAATVKYQHVEEARLALAEVRDTVREAEETILRRNLQLGELDIADALLIRNHFATQLGEQPLSYSLLRERHPMAFEGKSDDAMAQRWHRLKQRAVAGGLAAERRKSPALIDIAVDALTKA